VDDIPRGLRASIRRRLRRHRHARHTNDLERCGPRPRPAVLGLIGSRA
jgi:hypothetical protein